MTEDRPTSPPRALRTAKLLVAALCIAVLAALILLWPGDVDSALSQGLTAPTEQASVESIELQACPPPQPGECGTAAIELEDGESAVLQIGNAGPGPELSPGDEIRVTETVLPGTGETSYSLADFERRTPMLILALVFAALVIAFGRLRGALSLVGLGISLGVIIVFLVPAILDGKPPLLVAVVGSLAVMIATISLAHGLGPKSLAAILGTSVSLILVALLAGAAAELTQLTGFASEEAAIINLNVAEISFQGLLIAGMIIGALGVLDDVTVSQSSTVFALRSANPEQGARQLFTRAMTVGRDHVSATVNTLVLAYVGSSLPVLLLFSVGSVGLADVANTELVATEIVGMLVGSIGLVAAVPITTGLAALLAERLPPDASAGSAHVH